MPTTIISWEWEEAFDKFGFGDGDGWNGTNRVSDVIDGMGYDTDCDSWGIHNYMILDIKKDGKSILFPEKNDTGMDLNDWLPEVAKRFEERGYGVECLGYAPPRAYLPQDIIDELDKVFDDEYEAGFHEW